MVGEFVYLEYQVCPHEIENLKNDEEGVEDVVSRKHVNIFFSCRKGRVQYPAWKQVTSESKVIFSF